MCGCPPRAARPPAFTWVGASTTQQGRNTPHFGPDPERVYVWGRLRGRLLSMRYDGTDVRTIVKVTAPSTGPGGSATPDEVVLSPDGRRAIVRANRNVFLITVPPVGGNPATVSVAGSTTVPTRRLTSVGGDFVGWRHDGGAAFYSIGRSFFEYDIAAADALIADSLATARAERAKMSLGTKRGMRMRWRRSTKKLRAKWRRRPKKKPRMRTKPKTRKKPRTIRKHQTRTATKTTLPSTPPPATTSTSPSKRTNRRAPSPSPAPA